MSNKHSANNSTELSDLQKWQTRKRHASAMYEENCTAALALPEPHRSQALASARDESNSGTHGLGAEAAVVAPHKGLVGIADATFSRSSPLC